MVVEAVGIEVEYLLPSCLNSTSRVVNTTLAARFSPYIARRLCRVHVELLPDFSIRAGILPYRVQCRVQEVKRLLHTDRVHTYVHRARVNLQCSPLRVHTRKKNAKIIYTPRATRKIQPTKSVRNVYTGIYMNNTRRMQRIDWGSSTHTHTHLVYRLSLHASY